MLPNKLTISVYPVVKGGATLLPILLPEVARVPTNYRGCPRGFYDVTYTDAVCLDNPPLFIPRSRRTLQIIIRTFVPTDVKVSV